MKEILIYIKSIMFLFVYSFLGLFLIGLILLSIIPIVTNYELYVSETMFQTIKDSFHLSLRGAVLLVMVTVISLFLKNRK